MVLDHLTVTTPWIHLPPSGRTGTSSEAKVKASGDCHGDQGWSEAYWPRICDSREICSDCLADRLKKGTAIFAKVARIVTLWYGSPTNKEVVSQMVEDTIHAWKSGIFDGTNVFQAGDACGATFVKCKPLDSEPSPVVTEQATKEEPARRQTPRQPKRLVCGSICPA
ncbi:hypothetical protein GR210_12495 [Rhizobium leguminosarum]|uniref:hypothetical protein n=1 Tax=Rhizobium leguminosarum TaxID=384 RepID=UPI0013DCDC3B|nr:hypothetical protein [Rhizobium leguminosarum]NEH49600.1 hypothetical protein [Rhizobium leguminosarum]